MKKKLLSGVMSAFLIISILTTFSTNVTANELSPSIESLSEFKKELNLINNSNDSIYNKKIQINKLLSNISEDVATEFVKEKLDKLEKIDFSSMPNGTIDLGDGCYIKKSVNIESDPLNSVLYSSTPGATTLWKKYGSRQFTSTFDGFLFVASVQLNMCNHYTLSDYGISPRYVEAWTNSSGLIAAEHGSVNETKRYAKEGETVSSNCIFKLSLIVKGSFITKNYKMYNNIKCSSIDKTDKEVKVVQSWYGNWI